MAVDRTISHPGRFGRFDDRSTQQSLGAQGSLTHDLSPRIALLCFFEVFLEISRYFEINNVFTAISSQQFNLKC